MKSILLKTSIPGPKSAALMARRRAAVARGPFHGTPVFVDHAHGALITDVDGNVLIDLAAGIGVANTGHTPEKLVNAIMAQAGRLLHGSFNVTPYESYVSLCEKLNAKTPGAFTKSRFLPIAARRRSRTASRSREPTRNGPPSSLSSMLSTAAPSWP